MRSKAATCGLALVALMATGRQATAADAPRWVRDVLAQPAGPVDRSADAIVLLDEEQVTVQANGRIVKHRQFAVRVQTKAGGRAAVMRELYTRGSGDVRSLKGWVLLDGRTTELDKDRTVDVALVSNDVYNEARVRALSAADQMLPGAVFAGESEVSESTVFSQVEWWLHGPWPIERLRRTLTLPEGWQIQTAVFNHAPMPPAVTGTTRAWTLERVPADIDEPNAPPDDGRLPRLAVTYFGTPRADTAFDSWGSVGRWLATIQDPSAAPTPALAAKARELAPAGGDVLARLRAIGAYVQQVQYISIQTGIGRGGGYKPHLAGDVLQKNYGDCKDKANLMRALLATLDMPSSLVGIYSGDRTYVREEWPSPQQFNHAIIAIPVARGTRLPAVAEDESGATLFFDPTDPYVPLGELPLQLQGSAALVVSPTLSRLVRLPLTTIDAHMRERTAVASLAADGVFTATVHTTATGQLASRERALYRLLPGDGYVRQMEAATRSRYAGIALTADPVHDDVVQNRFVVETKLQSRTMTVSGGVRFIAGLVPLGDLLPKLSSGSRQMPVDLDPRREEDRFELTLPATLRVDELPPSTSAETAFARFDVRWTLDGSRLVRVLSLRVNQATIPPAQYAELRAFIDKFRDAEKMAAVIARR